MELAAIVPIVVIAAAIYLIVRGWDVRLVLLLASVVISLAAGLNAGPAQWFQDCVARQPCASFLATFSNEKFVVPICSAMGFAYVLRRTRVANATLCSSWSNRCDMSAGCLFPASSPSASW